MAIAIRNFQSDATEQGARFHAECIRALMNAGFEIHEQKMKVPEVGIEIDAVTHNREGLAMPWEFKGSEQGMRPGLHRTDTMKKAIANGYLFSRWEGRFAFTPLLVMTSHMPSDTDGAPAAMHAATERRIVLEFVNSRDHKRLLWLYRATEAQLRKLLDE
jgi:hypothetical protein